MPLDTAPVPAYILSSIRVGVWPTRNLAVLVLLSQILLTGLL
jgi:hypothetical protein